MVKVRRIYARKPKPKPKGGSGKYAPKLTFDIRCGYYYAAKIGIPDWRILAASNLHRSSLTRLLDDEHASYKAVKEEYQSLGDYEFGKKYFTYAIKELLEHANDEA